MSSSSSYGENGYGTTPYGQSSMTKEANVTITLEEKGKLTVTVNDGNGNAISGVSINISGESSGSAETDSNGVAIFNGIPIGSYTITATKSGWFENQTSIGSGDFS